MKLNAPTDVVERVAIHLHRLILEYVDHLRWGRDAIAAQVFLDTGGGFHAVPAFEWSLRPGLIDLHEVVQKARIGVSSFSVQ